MKLPKKESFPLGKGIYKTGPFHKNQLFQVHKDESKKYIVRSWEEAFELIDDVKIKDVNNEYISKYLFNAFEINVSPYRQIQRISNNSILETDNTGIFKSKKYPLFTNYKKEESHYKVFQNVRNEFKKYLKAKIQKNNESKICVEHSGGIDSNSILGILINERIINREKLYTWSENMIVEGEDIKEYRKFFKLQENNCLEHKIIKNNKNLSAQELFLFGFPPFYEVDIEMMKTIKKNGCKMLFSGWGGDQCISHHGGNVPIELVNEFKIIKLLKYYNDLKFIPKIVLKSIINKLFRYQVKERVKSQSGFDLNNNILFLSLTNIGLKELGKFAFIQYPYNSDSFITQRRIMSESLLIDFTSIRAEIEERLANTFGIKKYFPYLNKNLIDYVLSQDMEIFSDSYKSKRKLARNAFGDYLPHKLKIKTSKDMDLSRLREIRSIAKKQNILSSKLKILSDLHPILIRWFNRDKIKSIANQKIDYKNISLNIYSLSRLEKINNWLWHLD